MCTRGRQSYFVDSQYAPNYGRRWWVVLAERGNRWEVFFLTNYTRILRMNANEMALMNNVARLSPSVTCVRHVTASLQKNRVFDEHVLSEENQTK
jgi:hypothetical protein